MFQQLKQELMVYTVSSKAVGIKRNGDLRHIYKKEFTELVWQCDIEKDKAVIQGESQGLSWTYIKRMQVPSTEMGNQKGQQVWSKFYKEKIKLFRTREHAKRLEKKQSLCYNQVKQKYMRREI